MIKESVSDRPFLGSAIVNTIFLCVLVAGFVLGYFLDIGLFRTSSTMFVFAIMILTWTIILYCGIDFVIWYKKNKR